MEQNKTAKKRLMKTDGEWNTVIAETDFRELAKLYRECVERLYAVHSSYFLAPHTDYSAVRLSKKDRADLKGLTAQCDQALAKYEEFRESFKGDDGSVISLPDPLQDPRITPLSWENVRDTEWMRLRQQLKKSLTGWQTVSYIAFGAIIAYLMDTPYSALGLGVALLWIYLTPNYSDTLQLLRQRGREVCPLEPLKYNEYDTAPLVDAGITYSDIGTPWEGYLKTTKVTVDEVEFVQTYDSSGFVAKLIKDRIPRVYNDDLGAMLVVARPDHKTGTWTFQGHLFYRASHVEKHEHAEWTMWNRASRYERRNMIRYRFDYKDLKKYGLA